MPRFAFRRSHRNPTLVQHQGRLDAVMVDDPPERGDVPTGPDRGHAALAVAEDCGGDVFGFASGFTGLVSIVADGG